MTRWNYLPKEMEMRVICKRNTPIVKRKNETFISYHSDNKKPLKRKYGNKKTMVDGILFDSKKESEFYRKLKLLKRAGEIKEFELQPRLELQEKFKSNGETVRAIVYVADFMVMENNGHKYYVDTKGFRTNVYKLKKKMLLYKYAGIDFREE